MDRTNRSERIGLGAMALMALVSLFVVAHGYVGLGVLLFLAAATPLPVLAAIRARSSRDGNASDGDPVSRRRQLGLASLSPQARKAAI